MTNQVTAERLLYAGCSFVIALLLSACGSPSAPTPTIPTISGQWNGAYTVTSCSQNAQAPGACTAIGGGGTHALTPTQSGSNFSGQLGIGIFSIPISGSVDMSGTVTLAGTGPVSFATLTVTSWRASVTGNSMTGTMSYSVFADGGIVTVTGTTTLTR